MITVYDFVELCMDSSMLEVVIYDSSDDYAEIYSGYADEIPDDIADLRIDSVDLPPLGGVIGINVFTEGR